MRRLPLELIERLRALRPTAERPQDHVGFVATAAGVYFLIAAVIEVWRFLAADIIKPIWTVVRPWLFAILLGGVVAGWPTPGLGAPNTKEAAAATLAAANKLVCHRNFTASGWTTTSSADFYRESDQTSGDTSICGPIVDGYATQWVTFANTPSVATGINGYTSMEVSGEWGANFLDIAGYKSQWRAASGRFGMRMYRWQSADYLCGRGKNVQVGQNGFWSSSGAIPSPSVIFGPTGQGPANALYDDMKLKWWRWETYWNSWVNPTELTMYMKNITDGTAETSLVQTLASTDAAGMWGDVQHPGGSGLFEPTFMEYPHDYRESQSGNGFCTTRHMFMIAAKNLGATERIPVASEIEGTASSRGFILRMIIPLLIVLGLVAWRAAVTA